MTGLLPLYLRREPTQDSVSLRYNGGRGRDVVAYADADCTIPRGRWYPGRTRPHRGQSAVTLNCYRWRAVWLADVPAREVRS